MVTSSLAASLQSAMSKDFRSRSGMRGFSLARCAEKFAVWLHFALYVNAAAAILLFMSMYAPIVLLCSNVGRLTLIIFAFETLRPNGQTCVLCDPKNGNKFLLNGKKSTRRLTVDTVDTYVFGESASEC